MTNEKTCDNCACCKVCDHYLYGFENCGNWVPKWTLCSEQLPKDRQKVLVTLEEVSGKQFVRVDQIIDGSWRLFKAENIKAWMPLPEPYKEVAT